MNKARISELLLAKNDLESLRKNAEKLPIRAWYWIGKIYKYLNKEFEDFQEAQNNLIKRYGEANEEGSIQVPKNKMTDFQNDLQLLVKEEVELEISDLNLSILDGVELMSNTFAVSIFFAPPKEEVKDA